MTIQKLLNSAVGFVTTGIHLGYTMAPDYKWQEIYYKEDGSLMAYPCNEKDVNPAKILNPQILSSNQRLKDIIRFNITEFWKIQSQQALIEAVDRFCMIHTDRRKNATIYIVSATPIGFMSDMSEETFCRTYYSMDHLFCLPCEKYDVKLNRVVRRELLNYNGTGRMLQQLSGYDFIELDSLRKTDALAQEFQKEFSQVCPVDYFHYLGDSATLML